MLLVVGYMIVFKDILIWVILDSLACTMQFVKLLYCFSFLYFILNFYLILLI